MGSYKRGYKGLGFLLRVLQGLEVRDEGLGQF